MIIVIVLCVACFIAGVVLGLNRNFELQNEQKEKLIYELMKENAEYARNYESAKEHCHDYWDKESEAENNGNV